VPTACIHAFIIKATGDNTCEIIDTFDLFGGHNSYYGGYSDVGDVDGDGIPEIALEGCQNIYIIKAAGNDAFYVWEILPGNTGGSSVRVYDIDGNGLSEVVISVMTRRGFMSTRWALRKVPEGKSLGTYVVKLDNYVSTLIVKIIQG